MILIDPQGNYPRHVGDLIISHPDWQEGQALPLGWTYVQQSEIPTYNTNTERLIEKFPEVDEAGVYNQKWEVVQLTQEELDMASDPRPPHERI